MKKIITLLGLFLVGFMQIAMAQVITISNVTSTKADGSYNSGNIDITLTLAEAITTSSLELDLTLNSTAVANLIVADGTTSTLAFTYTIGLGEETPDLETTGLTIISGTAEDGLAVPITSFVLPTAGATGSLSKNKNLLIDRVLPTVTSVTSTNADGTYKIGNILYITVNFSEKVKVTGIPKIELETGTTNQFALYTGGTNTNKLSFKYTVQASDTANDLDYTSTIALIQDGGSTIKDFIGNDATLTLAAIGSANSLGGSKAIKIDGIRPVITLFTATGSNPAHANDIVTINIVFNQPVIVTGTPKILLETGKTDRYATYVSGSTTKTLVFNYEVGVGDETANLNAKSASALSAGTFKDPNGNDAVITLPALSGLILVDAIVPKVTNVTSTTLNGTYKVGDPDVLITIEFNDNISVTGIPTLALTGISDGVVTYTSTTLNKMTFTYVIGSTDNTADLGYIATNSLAIGSGITIKDANDNDADLTLPNLSATGSLSRNKAIVIDNTKATVVSVSSTTIDGTYKIGSTIFVNVIFTEKVKVTGKPRIQLETGATDQYAYYNGGNNSTKLTFKYTVQASDTTNDLNYVATSSLNLNTGLDAGTIKDYVGNDATLDLPGTGTANSLGGSKAIKIDGIRPAIIAFTSSGSNPANATEVININIVYDQPVIVTGTPKILLETGKTDHYATYASGSGTKTLVFNYLVVVGDETATLREKSPSSLTSGTFKDPNGNEAEITLPALTGGILVDAIAPTVVSVTTPDINGYYVTGDPITITVQFSENLTTAANTLQLTLGAGIGSPDLTTGTVVALNHKLVEFTYIVADGDQNVDLNYASTTALTGAIEDENGNAATLTLPTLTSRNSLAGSKNLYVDAKDPIISNITSPNSAGTYNQRDVIYIKVYFDDKVKVVGKPKIELNSSTTNFATYYSGSGSNVLQFKYTVGAGDIASPLDFDSFHFAVGESIDDYAGNPAGTTYAGAGLTAKLIEIDGSLKSAEIENAAITAISDDTWSLTEEVAIYPNPATNGEVVLHFNSDNQNNEIQVNLFDILGHKVASERFMGQSKVVIAKNLQPGIYIVSFVNGSKSFNQRIVVK